MRQRSGSKSGQSGVPVDVLRLRKVIRLQTPIEADVYEILPRPMVGNPMALIVPLSINRIGDTVDDGQECSAFVYKSHSSIGDAAIEIDPETHETMTFDIYHAHMFRLIAPIGIGELGILFD